MKKNQPRGGRALSRTASSGREWRLDGVCRWFPQSDYKRGWQPPSGESPARRQQTTAFPAKDRHLPHTVLYKPELKHFKWRWLYSPRLLDVCIWREWSTGPRTSRWVCVRRGGRSSESPSTAAPRCSCPAKESKAAHKNKLYRYDSMSMVALMCQSQQH